MQDSKFDDFWRASELDKFTIADFANGMAAYKSNVDVGFLEYSTAAKPLPRIRSQNSKIAVRRKSGREFSDKPLNLKQLSTILSAFRAQNGPEHRNFPAAGAVYTTEVFQVVFNGGEFSRKIIYYNPVVHGVVTLPCKSPTWNEAQKLLNIETVGVPQSLILFVSFPGRTIAKYGERGGRFALLEVGAAMQQLALTIAENPKLKGVAVGGVMDESWLEILDLSRTDARVALGYLVGQ